MEPHTATHLKEKRFNRLKDYAAVAGQLGVSHFVYFSQNEHSVTHVKMFRFPHGPSLHFTLQSFSAVQDVHKMLGKSRSPGLEFAVAPVLILNNFEASNAPRIALAKTFFKNMFPTFDAATVKLTDCRRVVLVHYDDQKDTFSFRHFLVNVKMVGVTRSLKNMLQNGKIPDMHNYADISDLLTGEGAEYGTDSEAEEASFANGDQNASVAPKNVLTLQSAYVGRGNKRNSQRKIHLIELGPRMELTMLRIQQAEIDGKPGKVLYDASAPAVPASTASNST